MTGRWVVYRCWTSEASLSGYDTDEVISTAETRERAEEERDDVAPDHIGTIAGDSWCIGVGIAPEPQPGYAPNGSDKDLRWADYVPEAFEERFEEQA